jgi:hypothetical protein
MGELLRSMSFKTSASPVPFVLHVNNRRFATVPKRLLCLRFQLPLQSLLVEKKFNWDGKLSSTIYQRPIVTNNGTFYKVIPGRYTVIGGGDLHNISHASTHFPGSISSFQCKTRSRLKPTLPSVNESLEFTILSSFDDEEADPANPVGGEPGPPPFNVAVKLKHYSQLNPIHLDCVDLEGDDDSDDFGLAAGQSPSIAIPSNSFVVSEMLSRTIGSDSIRTSEATTIYHESPSGFRGLDGFALTQSSDGNCAATSICSVYDTLVALGN